MVDPNKTELGDDDVLPFQLNKLFSPLCKFDCREVDSDSNERVVKRAFLFSIGLYSFTKIW